jgi:hypothetical protein
MVKSVYNNKFDNCMVTHTSRMMRRKSILWWTQTFRDQGQGQTQDQDHDQDQDQDQDHDQ